MEDMEGKKGRPKHNKVVLASDEDIDKNMKGLALDTCERVLSCIYNREYDNALYKKNLRDLEQTFRHLMDLNEVKVGILANFLLYYALIYAGETEFEVSEDVVYSNDLFHIFVN